jgi:hypothetical protein
MSKVLVDRELLCHALSGGVKGEHARSELRGMLSRAQPAEAEGALPDRMEVEPYQTVHRGSVNYRSGWNAYRNAAIPVLASVTAERDALLAEREGKVLVPTEPTIEMIAALGFGGDVALAIGHAAISEEVEQTYKAMLSAALAAKEA